MQEQSSSSSQEHEEACIRDEERASPRLVKDETFPTSRPILIICLPTYNGEAYVETALNSILNQSYTAFEVVIVDDGSTDRTLDLVCQFQDLRLRIYQNQQQRGIPGNWNECIGLARGRKRLVLT